MAEIQGDVRDLFDAAQIIRNLETEVSEIARPLLAAARSLIEYADTLSTSDTYPPEMPVRDPHPANGRRLFRQIHGNEVNPIIARSLAGRLYSMRRLRAQVFRDADLFGEPAWDMLLDLLAMESRNQSVSVTSACMGSCAPPTTALRYVALFEERGLLVRAPDQFDARRAFLSLSDRARRDLDTYFALLIAKNLV